MKKKFSCLFVLLAALPLLASCRGYDYTKHISELRSDIFRAETEEFTVTICCISREYPYLSDGIPSPRSDVVEISLVPVAAAIEDYFVYLGDGTGGEMSFRNTHGDWFYSESVKIFPEHSVEVRVQWGENERTITATSVRTEETMTAEEALQAVLGCERERIKRMTDKSGFHGEFHVRLLRREKTYYYVGIVGTDGTTLALLLDSETGEVLARRESKFSEKS